MKPFINPITGLQIGSEQKTSLMQDLQAAMSILQGQSAIKFQGTQDDLMKQEIIKQTKMNAMREGLPDNFYEVLTEQLGLDVSEYPKNEPTKDLLTEQLKTIYDRISTDHMKPGWQESFQLFK